MKTLIFSLLAFAIYSNALAQSTFRSSRHDYMLVTPSWYEETSKSGFDYYAEGPLGSTISVKVQNLSGAGTVEEFDEAVSDDTLLSGFRSQNIRNPVIIDRGIDSVNGEDFFFVAINTGTSEKQRMIMHMFIKGNQSYNLITVCDLDSITYLEHQLKSAVRSFTIE